MEQMVITIKDGSIKVEVEGVKGIRCVELTQAFEQMMGKVEKRFFKQNFYISTEKMSKVSVDQFINGVGLIRLNTSD
jgi:hypothetical protein